MSRLKKGLLIAIVISLHQLLLVPSKVIQQDAGCCCRNLETKTKQVTSDIDQSNCMSVFHFIINAFKQRELFC